MEVIFFLQKEEEKKYLIYINKVTSEKHRKAKNDEKPNYDLIS